jgi:hypothetical protein
MSGNGQRAETIETMLLPMDYTTPRSTPALRLEAFERLTAEERLEYIAQVRECLSKPVPKAEPRAPSRSLNLIVET